MQSVTTSDNHELIARLKLRANEGFAMLYDQYGQVLSGIIYKIVGNTAVAEDVLQDVFVKLWKNIEYYDEEKASLFTWMLSITRHTAIDYLRSRQNKISQKIQNSINYEHIESVAVTQPPDAGSAGYRSLVAKLEPKYKEIIDLVYFWGYTQEEVSKMLELPLGTVKTRARTGLQILRNLL